MDYFPIERKDWAYQRLLTSIKIRFSSLDGLGSSSVSVEKLPEQLFTPAELGVGELLSRGQTLEQIANELEISSFGVSLIIEKLYLKTTQPTIQKLITWWKRNSPGKK